MIKLSIILPTRNRSSLLRNTLITICKQTICQSLYEVIVCDNNSSDDTEKVVKELSCKFENFKYFKTLEPGLHVGRNRGFQEAQGDILVYADDDIEAFPEWLYTINEVFKDEDVVLVGGKNIPKWEIEPPNWALEIWKPNANGERISCIFSIIDLGNEIKEIDPYYVFGCNFSIRKDIILQTQGFHPDGMPQELIQYRGDGESAISDYIKQHGYKTVYHPNASVYHLVAKERLSLDYIARRGFNQGVSDSYTKIRNRKESQLSKFSSIKCFIKRQIVSLLKFVKLKVVFKNDDLFQKFFLEGYTKGYRFHQEKVKKNPELKEWVMKNNYL